MNSWETDLLDPGAGTPCEHAAFRKIEAAVRALGFEQCAFGLQVPHAFASSRSIVLNHFGAPWWAHYVSQRFLQTEPGDPPGHCAQDPELWKIRILRSSCQLRADALSIGKRIGWRQSSWPHLGVAGMLTLSCAHETLSDADQANRDIQLRWLVNAAHLTLLGVVASKPREPTTLTQRELEVLRWCADGRTAREIAGILVLSEDTVNFHVKKFMAKLQSPNKTAAVARALKLGLLH